MPKVDLRKSWLNKWCPNSRETIKRQKLWFCIKIFKRKPNFAWTRARLCDAHLGDFPFSALSYNLTKLQPGFWSKSRQWTPSNTFTIKHTTFREVSVIPTERNSPSIWPAIEVQFVQIAGKPSTQRLLISAIGQMGKRRENHVQLSVNFQIDIPHVILYLFSCTPEMFREAAILLAFGARYKQSPKRFRE